MDFICNIYNPEAEDAADHLVSPNVKKKKKEMLLRFIKDYISECRIGEPKPPKKTSLKFLEDNNIVGLYRTENTSSEAYNFLKTSAGSKKVPEYNPAEAEDTEYNTHLGGFQTFSEE